MAPKSDKEIAVLVATHDESMVSLLRLKFKATGNLNMQSIESEHRMMFSNSASSGGANLRTSHSAMYSLFTYYETSSTMNPFHDFGYVWGGSVAGWASDNLGYFEANANYPGYGQAYQMFSATSFSNGLFPSSIEQTDDQIADRITSATQTVDMAQLASADFQEYQRLQYGSQETQTSDEASLILMTSASSTITK